MRKTIIRWLMHYRRGREYISLIQSMMIGVIFLEQFDINRIHYYWIIPATIVIFILLGFIEKHFGIFKEIAQYLNSQNPEMVNINKKINEIYKAIRETKKA